MADEVSHAAVSPQQQHEDETQANNNVEAVSVLWSRETLHTYDNQDNESDYGDRSDFS